MAEGVLVSAGLGTQTCRRSCAPAAV